MKRTFTWSLESCRLLMMVMINLYESVFAAETFTCSPDFSCVYIDAWVPPDDGGEASQCRARSRHCRVVSFIQSCRQNLQRAVLPRWAAMLAVVWNLFPLCSSGNPSQALTDFLHCRPSACFRPPAPGLDAQLWRRHSVFHESAGCSGQSHPVTTWFTTWAQRSHRPLQNSDWMKCVLHIWCFSYSMIQTANRPANSTVISVSFSGHIWMDCIDNTSTVDSSENDMD